MDNYFPVCPLLMVGIIGNTGHSVREEDVHENGNLLLNQKSEGIFDSIVFVSLQVLSNY